MGLRLALTLAALALLVPSARADTIVFRVETDILRMNPDGSGQRAATHGEQHYEWPSAADDGTLAATDELGRLHRLTPDGAALGPPIPTAATVATEDLPADPPTHVRISPDGTKIAYAQLIDGDPTTLWTPASATGLDFPGQALGQQGFVAPSWIGNGRLLLSRDVTSDAPAATALYAVGAGDDAAEPWFDDPAGWATGFSAVASRDGSRIAVLEDDAADHDGVPTRVALRLFTAAGPGATPTFRCQIDLEAADTYALASPTFSPDGSRIAWAEGDGIHAATLGRLDDCAAIRERVLTLPGAWEPHWSPAADPRPAARAPAASKLHLSVTTRARPRRATLRRHGVRARVRISAPATVRLSVRVAGRPKRYAGEVTRRLANAGTTTVRVRLRSAALKRAKRLVLRASAPGAAAVELTLRPR